MAIKLNRKGVGLSGAERDKENENLALIEQEFERVGVSGPIIEEALTKAKAAESKSDNVQKQLSTLVVNGDSSPQAIQASVGVNGEDYGGNLKARLDAEQQKVAAQLADKVGGGRKATMNDLEQDVKLAMTGGSVAVVGVGSVSPKTVQPNAISIDKTDHLEVVSSNLFNKDNAVPGFFVNSANGQFVSDAGFWISPFVPVVAGEGYRFTSSHSFAFYNKDYNFISGGNGLSAVAPQNAYYVVKSISIGVGITTYTIVKQSINDLSVPIYQPYAVDLKTKQEKPTTLSLKVSGKNLVDEENAASDKSMNGSGQLIDGPNWRATDYLLCEPNTQYTTSFARFVHEYDESLFPVKGTLQDIAIGANRTFITSAKTKFIRVIFRYTDVGKVQVEKGATATSYEKVSYSLFSLNKKISGVTSSVNTSQLESESLRGTRQIPYFNSDGTISRIEHQDGLGDNIRLDVFSYETDLIIEVRTLITGESLTLKHYLDSLQTEVI